MPVVVTFDHSCTKEVIGYVGLPFCALAPISYETNSSRTDLKGAGIAVTDSTP
jgi:hypothetical protein